MRRRAYCGRSRSNSGSSWTISSIQHPSLHAKKYDESRDLWQARVNRAWRFYFTITDDAYQIEKVIPHPK